MKDIILEIPAVITAQGEPDRIKRELLQVLIENIDKLGAIQYSKADYMHGFAHHKATLRVAFPVKNEAKP